MYTKGALQVCLLLACIISCSFSIAAQTNGQTIKGFVVDRESLQPLVSASVYILNTDPPLGAITDIDGSFRIEQVPLGRRSLVISSIGYEDAIVQEVVVGAGKEIELNIQLTESLVDLQEVEITASRLNGSPIDEMATVSAQSFSVEQTKRYAAAINDPARMAQSFAGVANANDESNEIIIRGNNPRGMLWRMEGVEIPNPNHFSEEGASSGGISALSVNVLSNSDFFTGAFPAQYGNALSGVFDLRLRRGNNDKREYALQAGVLGLDIAAEGPIGAQGGASYLMNYRYSTLSVLEALGVQITGEGNSTRFQDATFKLHIPVGQSDHLSVWGLGGLSSNAFQFEGDPEISSFVSNRGTVGANYFHRLSDNAYLESILSYSATRADEDFEEFDFLFDDKFVNRAARLSLRYNQKIDARQTLQIGTIASQLSYELLEVVENGEDRTVNIDQTGKTYLLQAYAQYKWRIRTNLTATAGMHTTYFGLEAQQTIEPRLGFRWNYQLGKSLSLGFGRHSRIEALPVYLAEIPTSNGQTERLNRDLPLQTATHYVIGHSWRFADSWRWSIEAYYQDLRNVAIVTPELTSAEALSGSAINFDGNFANIELVADGSGRNFGIESTIERFFTNGWYLLSATSLFRSKYTGRDGIERPTRFASDFVQTILFGKEWAVGKTRENIIGLNLRLNWSGNFREAPIDLEASRLAGTTIRDFSRNFEQSLPNYLRFDVGVRYRKNRNNRSWVLSLDIQNITNRNNAFRLFYQPRTNSIGQIGQLGLIPVLNYRLEFTSK
ncbi:MAG: carboxypeptidase-like regulatory domain-containing protein [Bacteroidota bacterium]